jgi:hypothetical protein
MTNQEDKSQTVNFAADARHESCHLWWGWYYKVKSETKAAIVYCF